VRDEIGIATCPETSTLHHSEANGEYPYLLKTIQVIRTRSQRLKKKQSLCFIGTQTQPTHPSGARGVSCGTTAIWQCNVRVSLHYFR
jgi:hypothetical protein